jgi:TRAP-type C4-dicarboxylate transport system permease small subunit
MTARSGAGPGARLSAVIQRSEDFALALFLSAMILLASLQIFLRNFFDEGIAWADPLLRVLVLWVGLLGAMAASRGGRHISIDVLSRFLSPRAAAVADLLTSFFAAGLSALVAYHSARFVIDEREFGSIAFSGIPAWQLEIIIPVAFSVIALRYLIAAVSDAAVLLGKREAAPQADAAERRPE